MSKYYSAWKKAIHATSFDWGANLTVGERKKIYESFNEIRLLNEYADRISAGSFYEIGCATGELYRYLAPKHPKFRYSGFDISGPAIERAKEKFPHVEFTLVGEDLGEVATVAPTVLFARDVVLHQLDPFAFLRQLLSIPQEAIILRIRTRDKGATVLDPEVSCQWHYGEWVPYMVLNLDEVIAAVREVRPFAEMHIVKNVLQLGGHHNRFLPKECYMPETGTAETALYIRFSGDSDVDAEPQVKIEERADSVQEWSLGERVWRKIRNRLLAR